MVVPVPSLPAFFFLLFSILPFSIFAEADVYVKEVCRRRPGEKERETPRCGFAPCIFTLAAEIVRTRWPFRFPETENG